MYCTVQYRYLLRFNLKYEKVVEIRKFYVSLSSGYLKLQVFIFYRHLCFFF
jgi:hypothetical protein